VIILLYIIYLKKITSSVVILFHKSE